jgi:predicted ATPase
MKLTRIDVRFFRSFNYDYEARARQNTPRPAWDTQEPWYPFVKVPIDDEITAVVGANESGKSQLLTAIKALLDGRPIERVDFCRYSELYSVKVGEMRLPHFGGEFQVEESDDLSAIPSLAEANRFELYRFGDKAPIVVVNGEAADIDETQMHALQAALPRYYELATALPIPESVSIAELAGVARTPIHDRRKRSEVISQLAAIGDPTNLNPIIKLIQSILTPSVDPDAEMAEKQRRAQFELARSLLIGASRIDPSAFDELRKAVERGREGEVEALVGAINSAIKENLNVQRWWTQDQEFDLVVEAREHELAFTVRDRTGARYSFGERSQGLRYFLSYFVQLTTHRLGLGRSDLLLLDEPDAFLSSTGQQDLLRVLQDYSVPEAGGPCSQVVYVTHSPFLIDKNAPHRIRVLDKGTESEGTRVVRDAASNRYEPLRSALGPYLAETAFIGGRNLFVEGPADQVLLAGVATHIAQTSDQPVNPLDLNEVTVVACGGADSVPYMVYLARGRDTIKPPCVALLDGDKSGREAEKVLRRGEARKKRVLADEYIVRLDLWAQEANLPNVEEPEDLIPIAVAHHAALNYLSRFAELADVAGTAFSETAILSARNANGGHLWDALDATYKAAFPDEHLEKVGFAREVVNLINEDPQTAGADELRKHFGALLAHLGERLDKAAAQEAQSRGADRLTRILKFFEDTHPHGMKKHDARRLLAEIRETLASADFPEDLDTQVRRIEREFRLNDSGDPRVPEFTGFRKQILELRLIDRLAFQDDAHTDPASDVLAASTKTKGGGKLSKRSSDGEPAEPAELADGESLET